MDEAGPSPEVEITVRRPECCIGHTGGMVIGVWACSVRPYLLPEAERAVRAAFAQSPRGVTTLSVYRLGRRFPLTGEDGANLGQVWRTLQALRPCLRGSASVLESGGMLSAFLRNAVRGLELLTRSAVQLPVFERVNDALLWLLPRTVDALPLAHYRRALGVVERAHQEALAREVEGG